MTIHKPVLLEETINNLNLKEGDMVVDATLGGGGHGREILKRIGEKGAFVGIDLDIKAIKNFAEFPISNFQFPNNFQIPIFKFQNIILINGSFVDLEKYLGILEIEKVDAILADLGWSSDQMEDASRGLSFMRGGELDMRYDQSQEMTAKKIINEYSPKELERIIRDYGEERFYKNIAKRIVEYRKRHAIVTTTQLADIVKNAIPPKNRRGKTDPATRTFQAVRIETNKELSSLEKFVSLAIDRLKKGGRLGIITFHSLEDRIVKNIFRENAGGCVCPPAAQLQRVQEEYLSAQDEVSRANLERALRAGPTDFPQCVCGEKPKVKIITRKPIVPSEEEVIGNPRARSAKIRVCEKL